MVTARAGKAPRRVSTSGTRTHDVLVSGRVRGQRAALDVMSSGRRIDGGDSSAGTGTRLASLQRAGMKRRGERPHATAKRVHK